MARTDHLYMPKDHMERLYNSSNPIVKFVHKDRIAAILASLPKNRGINLLDAGCGEGHLIQAIKKRFPDYSYYGFDVSKTALQRARQRCPYAKIREMDLSEIKYPAGYFDIVICTEVLEHIYEYSAVIEELKRILKKGGYLIITFPNELLWTIGRCLLFRRPIKVPDHVNSFSPKQIKKTVNLPLIGQINLPLRLPFFLSLGCLMKFAKK